MNIQKAPVNRNMFDERVDLRGIKNNLANNRNSYERLYSLFFAGFSLFIGSSFIILNLIY